MSTSFPGALDALTNPAATDGLTGHAAQHANANDAIEALEAKVGVDNSTDPASLDYRVATLESGGGGGIWGSITGALSDQTDLQAALNGKLSASATTDAIAEGSSNLYFTAARVRDAVLTGLSTATNAVIAATDSVLTAFGKLQAQISGHTSSTANPHSVTKTQVGLGNVDNTADLNKPVSTATQAALALKANLVSPAFTTPDIGVATGTSFNSITGLSSTTPVMDGTAAVGTGTTTARGDHRHPTDTSRAPIASPSFTGPVTAQQYYNVTQPYGALQVGGVDVMRFGSDKSGQLAGFRNKIINGAFDVWQRGVAYLPAPVGYTADRWAAYTANTNVHRRSLGEGSLYYLELNTGGAVTNPQIAQRIEAANAVFLANKKATISLLARRPSGSLALQANVAVATVEDNFASKTTIANVEVVPAGAVLATWQKFSVTVDIPASAKNGIEIILYANGSTAITFDIAQVQLEEGSIATPFEYRPIGLEKSLCDRYFERILSVHNSLLGMGMALSGIYAFAALNYATKRAAPTVTITSGIVPMRAGAVIAGGTWIAEISGVNNARLATTAATGLVAGNCTILFAIAEGQYIDISAEL